MSKVILLRLFLKFGITLLRACLNLLTFRSRSSCQEQNRFPRKVSPNFVLDTASAPGNEDASPERVIQKEKETKMFTLSLKNSAFEVIALDANGQTRHVGWAFRKGKGVRIFIHDGEDLHSSLKLKYIPRLKEVD